MSLSKDRVPIPAAGGPEAGPELTGAEQRAVIRKLAFRFVPILGLGNFFCSLDKTNIGLAALTMNSDLKISAGTFGLASSLFFLGYALFELPSNLISYRVGPRKWLARIMISWGLVAAALSLVDGTASLYVLRILLGVAEAGFYPGMLFYIALWFPRQYRGRMLALVNVVGMMSAIFGSLITGAILSRPTYLGFAGWRAMFVFEGIPAAVVGVLCLVMLRDRPGQARWLGQREREWLAGTLRTQTDDVARQRAGSGSLKMLRDLRLVVLSLTYFAQCFGQYALSFFLPLMIVAFEAGVHAHYSTLHVSILTATPAAVSVIPAVLWAVHSDRTGERVWHSALPMFVGAAGICVSTVLHQPVWIMVALCVAYLGVSSQNMPFYQLPSTFATGIAVAGGFAMINAIGNVGGIAAPSIFGLLEDWSGSFRIASLLMGAVMAAGGVLLVTVIRPRVVRMHGRATGRSRSPVVEAG
jgi:MFS transporter, ACS family, tartrate transporter